MFTSQGANLSDFESSSGYKFKNLVLLQSALTHPSCFREAPCPFPFQFHFQRLEFLGDSIFNVILSQQLFHLFPRSREGFLSKAHSILARGTFLVRMAKKLNVVQHLQMAPVEKVSDTVLADTVEALMGSIFLDGGFDQVNACVLAWLGNIKQYVYRQLKSHNPKGQLQEKLGNQSKQLTYELLQTQGPPHQGLFKIGLYLGGKLIAEAEGKSKKVAEEQAALLGLKQLECTEKLIPTNNTS
ncbi:MAG: hypothetical protein LBF43_00280 [Puniceicoccales bacterium]|jgi:ribonuclease-3|nr:hypothetical protein [Puniceicoccales bacterium]